MPKLADIPDLMPATERLGDPSPARLRIPRSDWISIDPTVMGGKPCIRGTRVTVNTIVRAFLEGASMDEVLLDYPHLTKVMVEAALEFALAMIGQPFVEVQE